MFSVLLGYTEASLTNPTYLSTTMLSISLQNSSPCFMKRCISSYPLFPCERERRREGEGERDLTTAWAFSHYTLNSRWDKPKQLVRSS